MNPNDKRHFWGSMREIDAARRERNRIERLNQLRRGTRGPLPAWLKAPR